jgi:hypothetical protein
MGRWPYLMMIGPRQSNCFARQRSDGEVTKALAHNDGIIIVTFKDGHVLSISFEPVFFAPTYTIKDRFGW